MERSPDAKAGQNVASATVVGAELEFTGILTEALTLTGNIGYRHAKYNKFFAGVIGNGVPTDNTFFHFGLAPATLQSAYGLVNASVRYDDPSATYSVTLSGQNILDRQYQADANSNILVTVVEDGMPATWGFILSAKF